MNRLKCELSPTFEKNPSHSKISSKCSFWLTNSFKKKVILTQTSVLVRIMSHLLKTFAFLLSDKNDGQLQWWEDSRLLFLNKTMAVSNAISFIFCELSAPSLASRLICGLLLQQMAAKSVAHVNLQGQSIPLHSFTVGAVRNECALEFLYHTILMFLPNFHALVAFLLSSTPLFLSHLLHYSTICCSCSLDIFSQHKCA